jgi:aminopeptidase N
MRRAIVCVALLASAVACAASASVQATDYDATIRVDPATGTVDGDVVIRLRIDPPSTAISLDADDLSIRSVDDVTGVSQALVFASTSGRLEIHFTSLLHGAVRLRIVYSCKPKRGLRFTGDEVFTYFLTPGWLPCIFDPADRATIAFHIVVPAGFEVVANGEPVAVEPELAQGWERHTWREKRPYSAYLFGFAAGRLVTTSCMSEPARKRAPLFLAATAMPASDRLAICGKLPEMIDFLERTAGVRYPDSRFTFAFATGGLPQEAGDYAVLSTAYARSVIENPLEDYLLVHELAHSWWGNLITCADWSEFWLNEGMVTFLTAAFKEEKWGSDEYDRERFLARRRYRQAIREGKSRPLRFTAWRTADDAGGAIPYSKGALVLHLLRRVMGDADFWSGLRDYTRNALATDRLARTADFERIMQRHHRGSLQFLFDQWIAGGELPEITARHEIGPDAVTLTFVQAQSHAWVVPLRVAVETAHGRTVHQITLRHRRDVIRISARGGDILGIRVDDGSDLPEPVDHPRSMSMLAWQAGHEPDAIGRAEAIERLSRDCASDPDGCTAALAIFRSGTADAARLVQTVSRNALEELSPK